MKAYDENLVVIHVEDDPDLSALVRLAFSGFGFRGTLISPRSVGEARALFISREKSDQPIHMVITDMHLPDGTGIDVIRTLKSSRKWGLTPAVVLSSTRSAEVVNLSYSAGANLFLSKLPGSIDALQSLEGFYRCWLEGAILPSPPPLHSFEAALGRSVKIRSRVAAVYLNAARWLYGTPDVTFWLERSLAESNIANLLAFASSVSSHHVVSSDLAERFGSMQDQIEQVLLHVEQRIAEPANSNVTALCKAMLAITRATKEDVVDEVLGAVLGLSPEAVTNLQRYIKLQLGAIADYALEKPLEEESLDEAKRLKGWAAQLAKRIPSGAV